MIERICALAIARRESQDLLDPCRDLERRPSWLRHTPDVPSAKHLLEHRQGRFRIRVFNTQIDDSATNCLGAGENAGIRGQKKVGIDSDGVRLLGDWSRMGPLRFVMSKAAAAIPPGRARWMNLRVR
jgi:hypothetical protein